VVELASVAHAPLATKREVSMTSPSASAILPDLDGAAVFVTGIGSGIGRAPYATGLGAAGIAHCATQVVAAYAAVMG
jgi:hypothetical protein